MRIDTLNGEIAKHYIQRTTGVSQKMLQTYARNKVAALENLLDVMDDAAAITNFHNVKHQSINS